MPGKNSKQIEQEKGEQLALETKLSPTNSDPMVEPLVLPNSEPSNDAIKRVESTTTPQVEPTAVNEEEPPFPAPNKRTCQNKACEVYHNLMPYVDLATGIVTVLVLLAMVYFLFRLGRKAGMATMIPALPA